MRPVIESIEDAFGERCVDFIIAADGRVTFKEFRRDPEDRGRWTLLSDYSDLRFDDKAEARRAARQHIAWLDVPLKGQ